MPAKLLALAAYLIGLAGAGIFFAHVVGVGVGFWPRGEASDGLIPWLINVGWLLVFAVQHSGMARPAFKNWWTRLVPAAWERSFYVMISGSLLAGLTLSWQPLPGAPIWHGPTWIVAISLLAGLGIGVCCRWFDHDEFLGLRQAWTGIAGTTGPLHIDGPYRFVRHPIMLGLLIALWAQPIMPSELLLMNGGMTIYILIAIRLEERGLVREFGEEYEKYRREVPALIPFINRIV
jgi:protein-S-isoprenylcysteine O-methyltransferase Ste14